MLYLENNIDNQSDQYLRYIAEIANDNRLENAAFFTDDFLVKKIISSIPKVNKAEIHVLEPAAGTGNFVLPFIENNWRAYDKIMIDINDIDKNSLKVAKFFLSQSKIPENIEIRFLNKDFLNKKNFCEHYDIIIGNPPFQRIKKSDAQLLGDERITNKAGQFFRKALKISNMVSLVMPKNFLSTSEYLPIRNEVSKLNISNIYDFGEKGFKGVLIETIGITVNKIEMSKYTIVDSLITDTSQKVLQDYITDEKYPSWLIYRNSFFDIIASNMVFNVFDVYRDRQITNSLLSSSEKKIRVIKSRNIARDGSKILSLPGYDSYIDLNTVKKLKIVKYYGVDNVYFSPNMTYYPRIIKKTKYDLCNGSVAVMIPVDGNLLTKKEIDFLNSDDFTKFYAIARNKGTRSLNIDKMSVFWFGKYYGDDTNG